MQFDKSLQAGARGGHGPIRYVVESFEPGRQVTFRFTAPKGFDGYHSFVIEETDTGQCLLKHVLEMQARGLAIPGWVFVFRPLHDALVEDSLNKAQKNLGVADQRSKWSAWVKFLRWIFKR